MGVAPVRTCVGCRGTAPKSSLLRLVSSGAGQVVVDEPANARGRGAYVHRDLGCIDAALRRGSVARALRTGVGPDEVGRLRALLERMLRDT